MYLAETSEVWEKVGMFHPKTFYWNPRKTSISESYIIIARMKGKLGDFMRAWISNGNAAILVALQDIIPSGSCSEQPRWEMRSVARAASLSGDPGSLLEVLGEPPLSGRVALQEMRAD